MKSIDWIDRLIREKGLPSDRQAALLLGMTRGAISHHRTGKVITLDESAALRIEQLLDLTPGTVLVDQMAERAKDPEIRAVWQRLGKIVAGVAATVLVTTSLAMAPQRAQAGSSGEGVYRGIIIIGSWLRRALRGSQRRGGSNGAVRSSDQGNRCSTQHVWQTLPGSRGFVYRRCRDFFGRFTIPANAPQAA